jgi:hypothetical protein
MYQDETRSWRDLKVKKRDFDVGNLVPLRSPGIESSGKLKSKWGIPYVVIEKTRLGAYHLTDPQGRKLELRGMQRTFIVFIFKHFVRWKSRKL